ncbi:hypothetical protein [Methylobacterium mesophilicum]|uniref:hypothetical protein n=1 Tax=Methylobacterium mesophilicum TaxID=39956 RepID=UPI001EE370B2|nr:hypothetical protein [Methylobacterium mesophilicum]GJE20198.1 hypothetical protein JHFBIEKO_0622 [Methylobacterium mesophilicum]
MSGRKLDASYIALQSQLGAHAYARQAALRPGASAQFLSELGVPIGDIVKNRRKAIQEHFERVGRQIRRQGFTDLVSSFEADLFRLLQMASSKVRHILNAHYEPDLPFAAHREDLARTTADFSNLGGYRRLLAVTSGSGVDPRKDLWEIIAYRDFLAHGERWAFPASPPTLDFAYATLSKEINRIEASAP